jgi:hypothetical protein
VKRAPAKAAPRRPAPRRLERGAFDLTDATIEPELGPTPEPVFERATGPFGGPPLGRNERP